MEEKDKEILQNHWTDLTEMYASPRLLDLIFQEKGITYPDYEKLRKEKNMDEKNRCLLLCLMRKRNGLKILIESLLQTDNVHIAKRLKESCKTETVKINSDQYETLNMMILQKSRKFLGYDISNGQNRRIFHIVGATAQKAYIVRIYRENDFTKIPVGSACRFENLLKKSDGYLGTKSYKFSYIKKFEVNESVKQNAPMLPEEVSKEGVKRNIQEALYSYITLSCIKGKVVQKTEDAELQSLEISKEDFSRDDDFLTEERKENVTIEEFSEILVYPCCSNPDCRKFKVEDDECPNCKSPWMTQHWCRADFPFVFEDKRQETIRLFASDISAVLGENVHVSSEEAMITQIESQLPLKFSCTIKNNRIRNIVRTRPFSCIDA